MDFLFFRLNGGSADEAKFYIHNMPNILKEEILLNNDILNHSLTKPKIDTLIEGPVILMKKSSVFVDLSPFGTGIIYGREFINARDIIRKITLGDIIKAKIVEAENEDGYIELSLKEAKQALTWNDAEKAIKTKTIFELEVKEANKGGLILDWQGLQGFLPASQLNAEHYPRVEDSDKDKILRELKKLIGKKIPVIIISTLQKEGKLIFSEKYNSSSVEKKEILNKYNIGDELELPIAGLVDFGIFLKLEDNLEGLVHISEIDWGLVEDIRTIFKIGEKVNAKIIEIKDNRIYLSLKALKENPWNEFKEKLKKGDIIKGVVIKYNKFGALVSIKEGVAGLVHNLNFGSEKELRKVLELGKTYNFQITLFEPNAQRMTLVYLEEKTQN